jgi:signal transduction histidine kinase
MLDTTLDIMRVGIRNSMMMGERKNIQELLVNIATTKSIHQIRIVNEAGKILYSSDINELDKNINEVSLGHISFPPEKEKKIIKLVDKEGIYSNTEPIYNEPSCNSCHDSNKKIIAYLDVSADLTQAEEVFYSMSNGMIFLAVIVIVLLIIGLYFIFNIFVNKPLKKIIFALNEVQNENLDTYLPLSPKDEMGQVFNHFNKMVERIKTSKERINELHLEQLQRGNRLKILGELTAQTAHEINNHMAIVLSRADYLDLEIKKSPVLSKYYEDLNVLMSEAEKISKITGSLLKHSKKTTKRLESIDLIKTVENSLTLLQPILKKKRISLKNNYLIEKAIIKADNLQIEQIILNLVNNAIEALGNEGEIEIEISNNENDNIYLLIGDNGPGIPEELHDQIFSPFYTTKSPEKGTGLGLYIVKNLCNTNDAEITFESVPRKGTKFIITFKNDK